MEDVEDLVLHVANYAYNSNQIPWGETWIDLTAPWDRMTVEEVWRKYTGINLYENLTSENLYTAAQHLNVPNLNAGDSWETMYFKIFLSHIELRLPVHRPLILYEYPASMAGLARLKPNNPQIF